MTYHIMPEMTADSTSSPPRRPRRARRYAPGHWRARLAAFLDRLSARLNPLVDP